MENMHDIIRRPQKSHLQIRNRIECDTSKVPVYENQWVTASEGFQFVITLYSHESVDASQQHNLQPIIMQHVRND